MTERTAYSTGDICSATGEMGQRTDDTLQAIASVHACVREADAAGTRPRLQEIPGLVPILTKPIVGCAFAPRCGFAIDRCRREAPPLVEGGAGHTVACWEVERVRAST